MAANTRTFTDIEMSLIASPLTGDIARKYDENAIKQSVRNLIMTRNYERPFHPEIGSQVNNLLFEPFSPMLQARMEAAITNTINNFEPRVVIVAVNVRLNPDNNTAKVSIVYRIVNTQQPIRVELILKRTR